MPRRWLILIGLAGLSILTVSLAVSVMNRHGLGPFDVRVAAAWEIPGVSFLIAGWIAAWRRPNSRIGLLMMTVGLLWFAGQVLWIYNALGWSLSFALGTAWAPVLAHVFVSFPSGRLRARRDRQVMILTYTWYVIGTLDSTLTWHPVYGRPFQAFHNVFGVLGNQHTNDVIARVNPVANAVVVVLLVSVVISHWRRATPPGRRVLAPVLWASVPTGVWFALKSLSGPGWLGAAVASLVSGVGWAINAALPFGILVGLLRTRLGRGGGRGPGGRAGTAGRACRAPGRRAGPGARRPGDPGPVPSAVRSRRPRVRRCRGADRRIAAARHRASHDDGRPGRRAGGSAGL